jgi:hypothetical protein
VSFCICYPSTGILTCSSHLTSCWPDRRCNWSERDSIYRRCYIQHWRPHSDIHRWIRVNGCWKICQWIWRWTPFVRNLTIGIRCSSCIFSFSSRTIVPIYQSEISPPNHVCATPSSFAFQFSHIFAERGPCVCRIYGQHRWICVFGCKHGFSSSGSGF